MAELSNHPSASRKEATLERAIAAFPVLKERDVYVGISAKPRIENGRLKLDDGTEIKVGNLRLTLSQLAQRLDVPPEKLEQSLNMTLELGRFQVSDVDVSDNKVFLRGLVE
ncbi:MULTISPECIES: hypothetical protein [unclassified Coleofasciculus]|uniref:hypothetical protein n=1 Tax=unclassified Coleofasciculus TaxID=2692782 RepID=UPI00187EE9C1|nr:MULTISPECIES: hypothetical protein [unclassified Coleofasciculus]MBE9129746.1 hypothetical protein [Coleofasciculus sp. LEGE 07081]MBE9152235.1 hypothetical protein [Coleofasciculus sp. LEGE 07092]